MGTQADHKGVVLYRQERQGEPPVALPIDVDQITMGDDLSTNYQLQPGGRLVVPHNPSLPQGTADTETSERALKQAERSEDRSALLRVEQRLADVERKLDQLLEAIKRRKP